MLASDDFNHAEHEASDYDRQSARALRSLSNTIIDVGAPMPDDFLTIHVGQTAIEKDQIRPGQLNSPQSPRYRCGPGKRYSLRKAVEAWRQVRRSFLYEKCEKRRTIPSLSGFVYHTSPGARYRSVTQVEGVWP